MCLAFKDSYYRNQNDISSGDRNDSDKVSALEELAVRDNEIEKQLSQYQVTHIH